MSISGMFEPWPFRYRIRLKPCRASDVPMSTAYLTKVSQPIVIGPGKSMWCGVYPWMIGGRSTTSSGIAAAACRQISEAMRVSVSEGRWGP